MAEWDLTGKMSPFLDKHLVFPLLEFLLHRTELFIKEDLLKAKFELLSETSMVDWALDSFTELYPDKPKDPALEAKHGDIIERLKELSGACEPLIKLFQESDVQEIAQNSDLREHFISKGVEPETLETLYEYGRLMYDIGRYTEAGVILYQYCAVSNDATKTLSALWGRFAAGVLDSKWDIAMEDLKRIRENIDSNSSDSALSLLQQRTWLIHWSLFVFFNHEEGLDELIDLFLYQPAYANTIQTVCPWILRYLATAVITQSQVQKKRDVLKHLVRVIQQESYTYKDPITEFIECLYVNFDFDGAQRKLRECETVLINDFFLVARRNEFIENARLFIFETYCRIHNTISINMLAEKLNMDVDRAEQWIVNLMRHAHLDAKIDSKAGTVLMTPKVPSIYQQVIEMTNSLTFKSSHLADSIDRSARH